MTILKKECIYILLYFIIIIFTLKYLFGLCSLSDCCLVNVLLKESSYVTEQMSHRLKVKMSAIKWQDISLDKFHYRSRLSFPV